MKESLYDNIIGWQKTSFIDFPRTVSTVLFFSGCNLRCPYCHNKDIVYNKLPQINATEVNSYLIKRKKLIDGIVITGGEPTLHNNLRPLILHLKDMGYQIKVDTNGLQPNVISSILNDINYLAIDVKTSPSSYKNKLKSKYDDCFERLQKTIKLIDASDIDFEIRITIAQSIISLDDIVTIGELIKNIRGKVYLQELNKHSETLKSNFPKEPFSKEEIDIYIDTLLHYVKFCKLR
jgi:pyruvate formate lyase activating enzyme